MEATTVHKSTSPFIVQRCLSGFAAVVLMALLTAGCVATTGSKTGAGADGTDPNYDANGKPKAVQVRQTERGVQLTSDERVLRS